MAVPVPVSAARRRSRCVPRARSRGVVRGGSRAPRCADKTCSLSPWANSFTTTSKQAPATGDGPKSASPTSPPTATAVRRSGDSALAPDPTAMRQPPRGPHLTLACVLDKDSNRALQQLLSVSNTCSGQVLDFSNTSSRPLSPFRLVSAGSKAPQQC